MMRTLCREVAPRRLLVSLAIATGLLAGCAHPIVITPQASLERSASVPIKKNVGYFVTPEDKARQFVTDGGGGDKVSTYPYRDLDTAIYRVLTDVFENVTVLKLRDDVETIRRERLAYVFVPQLVPSSSSDGLLTWPPTSFTLILTCIVYDQSGKEIGRKSVVGQGKATFEEFKNNFGLAAQRASADALVKFRETLVNSPELRN